MNARKPSPDATLPPVVDDDEASAVDPKELLGFVLRAPGRHLRLAVTVFAVVAALAIAAALVMPRTYQADARILVQRNQMLAALDNPNRALPEETAPLRGAVDIILARDNLKAIIEEANLVEAWETQRAPIMKLKDRVFQALFPPMSAEDRMSMMVSILEKRLTVSADDNTSTVTISCQWPNAEMAFQIVSLAEKNFLDARHAGEVAVISDAIAILEEHANAHREQVDSALADMVRLQDIRNRGAAAGSTAPPAAGTGHTGGVGAGGGGASRVAASGPDAELTRLLETKRREIRDMQDAHARHLADLKTQLSDLRATYAPAHPTVIAMESKIEQASEEPQELIAAKKEERAVLAQLAASNEQRTMMRAAGAPGQAGTAGNAGASTIGAPAAAGGGTSLVTETQTGGQSRPVVGPNDEDAATAFARAKFANATRKYEEIMGRIDAARIELDTARAAFKYKFSVTRPPEVPKTAKKPTPALVAGGGIVAALALAVLLAALADFVSGRAIEAWQVRRLRLPVLGEVPAPSAPSR